MWAKHIEEQHRSGKTQRPYCGEHGLQPRVFRCWAQRLARMNPLASSESAQAIVLVRVLALWLAGPGA